MVSSGSYRKNGYACQSRDTETVFQKILEFHYLDVWNSSYCYDRARMTQPIIDSRIHSLSTNKIQHISANHQHNRLRQAYNRAPVERRLGRQLQPSLPEGPAYAVLVAARHQQPLLRLVGRGVDEIQETLLRSSVLTIARRTLHRLGRIIVPPGQPEYPVCDRLDR